jgi:LemA protein
MSIPFLVFLAAVGAMVVFAIVTYNRLVSLTQRSQASWSDVDVHLKRRTDLVPNTAILPLRRPVQLEVGARPELAEARHQVRGELQVPKVSFRS